MIVMFDLYKILLIIMFYKLNNFMRKNNGVFKKKFYKVFYKYYPSKDIWQGWENLSI